MSETEIAVVLLSLRVALACVLVSFLPALGAAWLLARRSRGVGLLFLGGFCDLPLVLPPVVTGYLLLILLGRQGLIGEPLSRLGLDIAFTWRGAALASAVVGFPLMVRAMRLGLESVDTRLEEVSRTLGAGPLRTFLTVTLPLAWPGLATGVILSFARSLGEFGATITLAANIPGKTQTLPLAIYSMIQQPGGESAAVRLVVISVVLALSTLLASELVLRRVSERRRQA